MSSTTTEKPPIDLNKQFGYLTGAINRVGQEAHMKIGAHIRAITGGKINSLGVYHATPTIPDADKAATYKLCFNAMVKSGGPDWTVLQGSVHKGDAKPEEATKPTATKPEGRRPTARRVDPLEAVPEAEADPRRHEEQAPRIEVSKEADPLTRAIIDTIQKHLKVTAGVDETAVEGIADRIARVVLSEFQTDFDKGFHDKVGDTLSKLLANGAFPEDRVKKLVEEATANMVKRIEFITSVGDIKPITGLLHPQATQLAAWLRAGVPVWAWGAAGSGKTHMAQQVAELLEITAQIMSVDPTLTVSKIMGYKNVANGGFIEGFVYKTFKDGGLFAMDEIDTGDPGVIASANALLSNAQYLFPNGETVKRHDKFYPLALANTRGMGAVAGYTARNKLDAATLDRFAIIEIKYDPGLESCLACGDGTPTQPWNPGKPATSKVQKDYVAWVQRVRAYTGDSVLISPRASINGCKALRAGIPLTEVVDALVFKLVTDDTRKRIKDKCGMPEA